MLNCEYYKKLKYIIIFIVLFALLSGVSYFIAWNSGEYEIAERFARDNPTIKEVLGAVNDIRPGILTGGSTSYSTEGGGCATLTLVLSGAKGGAVMDVDLSRNSERWCVKSAFLNAGTGELISVVIYEPFSCP